MALTKTEVSELYVSIFNRASEGEGNTYWQTNQPDMVSTANVMLATDAAKTYFGTSLDTDQAFIEHIYKNTLNKTVTDDPDGIAYWVGELATKSRGEVIVALINAAKLPENAGDAQDQFNNRVAVSDYMADTVQTAPADYATSTTFATSGSTGLVVTSDTDTVTTAEAAIDGMNTGIVGQTFVLTNSNNQTTSGVDNIVGTDNNDTVIGTATGASGDTYNIGDTIDGGAGKDKLILSVDNTVSPIKITNVETIELQANGSNSANFNASLLTPATSGTTFATNYSTQNVNIQNINSANVDFLIENSKTTLDALFTPAVVSGTDDNVNLTVNAAGIKGTNADFITDHVESITVTSTGSLRNYVDIASDDDNAAGASGTSVLKTVTIKGDQAIDINTGSNTQNTFATSVKSVDASENTAGVAFSIDATNGDLDIKGSKGDDSVTITTDGSLNAQDTIDLGDGTDTLIISADPGTGAVIKNVEALGIKNLADGTANTTIDASKITGIDKVTLLGVADDVGSTTGIKAVTINNAPTTIEADYVDYTTSSLTDGQHGAITINPATANKDYTLILNNNPTTGKTNGVDLASNGVTLNSVSSVTINSIGDNTKLNADTADLANGTQYNQVALSTTTKTVNLTGDTNLKFSTTSATVETIDASAFTGGVQITANTAKDKTITTGSGNDVVNAEVTGITNGGTDTSKNTIKTGAGDDWIVIADIDALSKKDTIDGGDGTDAIVVKDSTINWTAAGLTTLNGISNIEKIGLDLTNNISLSLGDTAMAKFNDDVTIVNYSPTSNNSATIDNSNINSKTVTVTTDFSTTTGNGKLAYTAGANIDVVTGTLNIDTFNVTDSKLGTSDSFDGGAGDDTLNLTLTGSGDSTDVSTLAASSLANIKSLETVNLDVGTADYAKVIMDNDFALNNQKASTNTLTITTTNPLTQDYLTVDASAVTDVQLAVDATNFAAKHVTVTTGSADDTLNIAPSATTVSVTNSTVDFGDGTDTIAISADNAGGALTATLTGSDFSNYEAITMDNSAYNVTVVMDANDISGQAIKVVEGTSGSASTLQVEGTNSGSGADDTIDLTKLATGTNVDTIVVNGNGGTDTIKLSSTLITTTTVDGGAGDDTINDGKGNDSITGGAGNDTISLGAGGTDTVSYVGADAATDGVDTINSFTAGASGDIFDIGAANTALNGVDGTSDTYNTLGTTDDVGTADFINNLSDTDTAKISIGTGTQKVVEIASAEATLSDTDTSGAIDAADFRAIFGASVADDNKIEFNTNDSGAGFFAVYDGTGTDADAYLFYVDISGATDTNKNIDTGDTVQLIGHLVDVGADTLTDANFF